MQTLVRTISSFELKLADRKDLPPLYLSARDALTILLTVYNGKRKASKEAKAGLLELFGDAAKPSHITEISFDVLKTDAGEQILTAYKGAAKSKEDAEIQKALFSKYIADEFIQGLILTLVQDGNKILNKLVSKKIQAGSSTDKTHKQSRSLLRSIANSVGRDASQPSLFQMSLQDAKNEIERQINESPTGTLQKEIISQKVAQLALELIKKYQTGPKDAEGFADILNISELADSLGTDTKYLKHLLLHLCGYQYTHFAMIDGKIGFKMAKYFDMWLLYSDKRRVHIPEFTNNEHALNLILNERIAQIKVKPTQEFINDLNNKKKSLGSIRVTDAWLASINNLSLLAFQFVNFLSTQKPQYSIYEAKLFAYENMDLSRQIKAQGLPRVRKAFWIALEEVKLKGHIIDYKIEERTDGFFYSWTYGNKYIKHQAKFLNQEAKPSAEEFIDYDDLTTPVEKRRARYVEFLKKTKPNIQDAEAYKKAKKKIPE